MSKKIVRSVKATLVSIAVVVSSLPLSSVAAAATTSNFNYGTALRDAICFYDANKCGTDAGIDNVFDWRDACHTQDGSDVGHDLTGGYHDCGDHVKFGQTQGYAASILGWSYYRYKDTFELTGNSDKMLQELKHFTDYFLKCHTDQNTFYYQVGSGDTDHAYWGAPEEQTTDRPAMFVADASHAASDVLGEASAALSLMYLNYKDVDEDYSERCLKAAKELYNMGKSNPGLSSGQGYYTPISYKDDLAWAACWLYTATGDESYLNDAREYVIDQGSGLPRAEYWALCWDDVYIAAELRLLELTGDSIYNDALLEHINYMNNRCETTPGGLKYITSWGSLRYAAAIAMIAEAYYEDTADTSALNLAKSQIDYILGDNPENMSYIIGYGSRWPQHPHHRAANGYTYIDGGNLKPAKNLLLGALVGGPDSGDVFSDDGAQYQYTEVGIDYNAALVGALAGLTKVYGSGTAVRNSVIAASSFTFDKDSPQDIVIPTEFNGNELDNIVNGATPLVKGSDYTVSDNAITIKQSYLASQSANTVKLMLLFSGGNVPYVTITMGSGGSSGGGSGGDSGGGSGGSGGTPTAPGSLEVQMYSGNTSAATNGIMPRFKLTNNGSDPIDLSSITLRYYFTENGTQNQNFWCDWSSAGTSYVTGKFVKLANAVTGADTYLEIGFTSGAGSLAPGASVEVQVRFSKADWTNYDQSDDYSFNSNANYYVDWSKVTAYQNGTLIWGVEP